MRLPLTGAVAVLLVFTGGAGCLSTGGEGPLVGDRAPAFTLQDLDNRTVGTNASQGRVLLIDFMGSNCPPCHAAMRDLVPLHEAYGDRVDFLSVDVGSYIRALGSRNEEELRAFRDRYAANWSFAMDTIEQSTPARYEVANLPTTVIVDAEGVIAFKEGGVADYHRFSQALDRLLPPPTS